MASNVYVSSTRLVVRPRALPAFLRNVEAVQAQVRGTDGFLGGALLAEPRLAFWTMTAWDGPRAMRAFRDGGVHAQVMPLLAEVGAEAAYVGWWQDDAALPPWAEVHRRFLTAATFTPLRRPSRRHQQRRVPAPRLGLSRPLSPAAGADGTAAAPMPAAPHLPPPGVTSPSQRDLAHGAP